MPNTPVQATPESASTLQIAPSLMEGRRMGAGLSKNGWAPVPEHRGARLFFASAADVRRWITNFEIAALLRNLSELDQRNIEIGSAWPSHSPSRNAFGLSAAQVMACLALFDHLRAVTSLLARSIIRARWRHWLLFPCGPGGTYRPRPLLAVLTT
jgi:hypothetical protein